MVKPPFSWLFIGPEGSFTPVHGDAVASKLFSGGILFVDAWTHEVQGSKLFRLWPQQALETLKDGQATGKYGSDEFADMTQPDMKRFPRCRDVPPVRAVLGPGQTIYIPTRYASHWQQH